MFIDNQSDKEFTNQDLINIKKFLNWENIELSDLNITQLPFGNHSHTLIIEITNPDKVNDFIPKKLIYKKSLASKNIETTKSDNRIFEQLSLNHIAPKYYGGGDNFRIEQYIESRVIKSYEINEKDIRTKLVIKLANIHRLDFSKYFDINSNFINTWTVDNTSAWSQFNSNIDLANKGIYTENELVTIKRIKYLADEDEKEYVRGLITIQNKRHSPVFSHNDIWVGNILFNETERSLYLIDYEVCMYNFPAYDLAKLILECMYKRYDDCPDYDFTEELMPSDQDILSYIRIYLVCVKSKEQLTEYFGEDILAQIEKDIYASEEEKDKTIQEFLKDVYVGMVLCGYYTAVLGIRLGKSVHYKMDFIKFAKDGLDTYEKYKKYI